MIRTLYFALILVLAGTTAAVADPALTLTPGGTVSGMPGDVVGWGFSLTNDTVYDLEVANSYFCENGQDPLFTTCTQSLGIYSDFIAANGTFIAPGDSAAQTFDQSMASGVGQYQINPGTAGQSDVGSIIVTYDLIDPMTFQQFGTTLELTAAAEVDVLNPTAAPEPRMAIPLALLLMAGCIVYRRQRAPRSRS